MICRQAGVERRCRGWGGGKKPGAWPQPRYTQPLCSAAAIQPFPTPFLNLPRCVITYTPSEGLPALQVLGRVLHEQACLFYVADAQVRAAGERAAPPAVSCEAATWQAACAERAPSLVPSPLPCLQRRLTAHVGRNVPNADLNLRTAFKVGGWAHAPPALGCWLGWLQVWNVISAQRPPLPHSRDTCVPPPTPHCPQMGALAEFRADWGVALRLYREAYAYLPQVGVVGSGAGRRAGGRAEVQRAEGGCLRATASPSCMLAPPQLLAAVGVGAQRFAEVRAVAEQVHVKVRGLQRLGCCMPRRVRASRGPDTPAWHRCSWRLSTPGPSPPAHPPARRSRRCCC